jgi:hypothetical protein
LHAALFISIKVGQCNLHWTVTFSDHNNLQSDGLVLWVAPIIEYAYGICRENLLAILRLGSFAAFLAT